MTSHETEYGSLRIGSKEELLQAALDIALDHFRSLERASFSWALTGGSTPKDFYRWVVENDKLPVDLMDGVIWTASDERMAPLESEENNFGNADRLMLSPLEVMTDSKIPWPTELEPRAAALAYAQTWAEVAPAERIYDVCFVGMGDDCHTLSLFPGSPLIAQPTEEPFAAVEVPGKGWRLTLTPAGLARCGRVVLMTLGAGKAGALKSVLQGNYDPLSKPSQSLRAVADRAVWLVDREAAAQLSL